MKTIEHREPTEPELVTALETLGDTESTAIVIDGKVRAVVPVGVYSYGAAIVRVLQAAKAVAEDAALVDDPNGYYGEMVSAGLIAELKEALDV